MGMTNEQDSPEGAPLPAAEARAAAEYHAPPETIPRDAMWNAIQARRNPNQHAAAPAVGIAHAAPVTVTHTTRGALARLPRALAAAATAAALVFAVSVARRTADTVAPVASVATASDSAATGIAWQTASNEHFGLAESMLTTLGYPTQSQSEAQLSAWSRDLLESTRLLMDSPAGRDPRRRVLLLELELVLVQLVESGPATLVEDRTALDQLLSRSALLLTRIRTIVPAGTSAPRN
jgi:hypothetical protein